MAMSLSSKSEDALKCRVFIGNLPSDSVTKDHIKDIFSQYGSYVDCSIYKNFGFVQFQDEKSAQDAVAGTNRTMMFDRRLDVKIATSGRRDSDIGDKGFIKKRKYPMNPNEIKPLMSQNPMDPHASYPVLPPPMPPTNPQSFYSNYYLPPPPGPYAQQPPRMPVPPPNMPPSAVRPPQVPQPGGQLISKHTCDIVCQSKKLYSYAEFIGYTIGVLGFSYNINVLCGNYPLETVMKRLAQDDITCAIVLREDNATHRSVNLHIFGLNPEEHRNMPIKVAEEFLENKLGLKSSQPPSSQVPTSKVNQIPGPSTNIPTTNTSISLNNKVAPVTPSTPQTPLAAQSSGQNSAYNNMYPQNFYPGYRPIGPDGSSAYYNMSASYQGAQPPPSYPPAHAPPYNQFNGGNYKRYPH
ncbi:Heterogeneous nuclear ribonucleoprotein C [Thelohanellus kitauei]|uniref:Heterogeneous nuclear ribonucleoprotein C n=1 Tax=Thelohanellus kitauei TaxID=669202 RepID=A0A0C2J857_THEKT|nr:Heterogeneous nuclear ribonucleoprotein C [Thelohanellus kitauei]